MSHEIVVALQLTGLVIIRYLNETSRPLKSECVLCADLTALKVENVLNKNLFYAYGRYLETSSGTADAIIF